MGRNGFNRGNGSSGRNPSGNDSDFPFGKRNLISVGIDQPVGGLPERDLPIVGRQKGVAAFSVSQTDQAEQLPPNFPIYNKYRKEVMAQR